MALKPPPFKIGKKQVFLPNIVLTLLRTPNLPSTFASFIVPLNLNKLDIRDYLFHAYDIRVTSVRSFVQLQRVQHDRPDAIVTRPRRWYRPRSKKIMTVEMERPFEWPDEPENFEPWDKQNFDAAQKYQKEQSQRFNPEEKKKLPSPERESIAAQAKAILKGEDPWVPRIDYPDRTIPGQKKAIETTEWQEVEQDFELPK